MYYIYDGIIVATNKAAGYRWAVFVHELDKSRFEVELGNEPYWANDQQDALSFINRHIRENPRIQYQYALRRLNTVELP